MRKLAFAALLGALAVVPVSAQPAPSPYSTATISESFTGLTADQNPPPYTVTCDWYPPDQAQSLVVTGSYRVIFTGARGWALCN